MRVNLKKIMSNIQKKIKKDWRKLNFDYSLERNEVDVTANLTLNNHDDDIRVVINVYDGGMAFFRAVFDKADVTPELLTLLNKFNDDNSFFTAFVREDGYLELRNVIAFYDDKVFKEYPGEFLTRLANLADDETLQQITSMTHG